VVLDVTPTDAQVRNPLIHTVLHSKEYLVVLDATPTDAQVRKLASGVVITTIAQRDGKRSAPLTAATKPCTVERTGGARGRELRFVLQEGRNRQVISLALSKSVYRYRYRYR